MKIPPRLVGMAAAIGVVALLAAPVVLYALNFHGSISTQHIRWAEFGAYVGGIYAPFAAFLTLLIISGQLSSQVGFNKHQIDQSFLANARADLHFYLDQLHQTLNRHEKLANVPLGHVLVTMFSSKSHEQLRTGEHRTNARRVTMSDDRISALWGAVYTIFEGLRAVDEPEYRNVLSSSKQKCIAMLGYAVCDALDNHHYVACDYPAEFRYEFHAGARPEL
ncbi:hypothetical protein [Lysobacter sp. N42]|uniref:hypothetical protein n=1 Tax=Lysobacter sp. N42 TaxID=2545719 RepID=UPI0014053DB9|nr:hypothetical protein [Lysobacter sp. N42]